MGLLRITLKENTAITSYMGGKPSISPLSDGVISILKSLLIGGDSIEVIDERIATSPIESNLTFTYNTDTAERIMPQNDDIINPLTNSIYSGSHQMNT